MPATPGINAPLIEVFSSLQGEGIFIGVRQVFVRFAGCNLDCRYCDTEFTPGPVCMVESIPGSASFVEIANPVHLDEITALVERWQHDDGVSHHSLALTGGEPLLHADILQKWLPEVVPLLPVFLETNGTLPVELEKILPFVDMISMDIKGTSVAGVPTPWDSHADFITTANCRLCQIKLVVDASTPETEIREAARFSAKNAPDIPFILQPRTLETGPSIEGKNLLALQKLAGSEHPDVRVVPQIHPWLGVA